MAQTTQISFEPGSNSPNLAHFLRNVTYQLSPPISFVVVTETERLAIPSASLTGMAIAPFNEAIKAAITDTVLRSLGGPAVAAFPTSALGVSASIPDEEVSTWVYGRSPVTLQDNGGALLIGGAPIFAVVRTLNTVSLGTAPNGSNLQWMFCSENNGELQPVPVPAGNYRASVPTMVQDRHRGLIRFADGSIRADPPAETVETHIDELQIKVTGTQSIAAGSPISIVSGASGLEWANPTGQAFDLSSYSDLTEFAADATLQIIVAGQTAIKGAVSQAANGAAETFVERLTPSQIRLSIDLFPGSYVRLIRPRLAALVAPAISLPPFTEAILTIPIADSSPSTISIAFSLTPTTVPRFLEMTSSNGSQLLEMPASGVPAVFTDGGTNRSVRVLTGGNTASEAAARVYSAKSSISGIIAPLLTYGGTTITDYTEGDIAITGSVVFGQNTSTLARFGSDGADTYSIDWSDGTISGWAPNTAGAGPSNGAIANILYYDGLRTLNLSNNLLGSAAIAELLTRLNLSASITNASVVHDLVVDLSGNPGANSIDLAEWPGLANRNITIIGTTPPAPLTYSAVYDVFGVSGSFLPIVTYTGLAPLSARWAVYDSLSIPAPGAVPVGVFPVGGSGLPTLVSITGSKYVRLEIESSAYDADRARITGIDLGALTTGAAVFRAIGANHVTTPFLQVFAANGIQDSTTPFTGFSPNGSDPGVRIFELVGGSVEGFQDLTGLNGATDLERLTFRNTQLSQANIEALLSALNAPDNAVSGAVIDLTENPGSASIDMNSYPSIAARGNTVLLLNAPPIDILTYRVKDGVGPVNSPTLTLTGPGALLAAWILEDGSGAQISSTPAAATGAIVSLGGGGVPSRRLRLVVGGATPTATAAAQAARVTELVGDSTNAIAGLFDITGAFVPVITVPRTLPNLGAFYSQECSATTFHFSGSSTVSTIDASSGTISDLSAVTTTSGLLAMSGLRVLDLSSNNLGISVLSLLLSALVLEQSLVSDLALNISGNPGAAPGQLTISPTLQAQLDGQNIVVTAGGVL